MRLRRWVASVAEAVDVASVAVAGAVAAVAATAVEDAREPTRLPWAIRGGKRATLLFGRSIVALLDQHE